MIMAPKNTLRKCYRMLISQNSESQVLTLLGRTTNSGHTHYFLMEHIESKYTTAKHAISLDKDLQLQSPL